ncbi:MAG: ribose-phosphate diphosphokinase [Nitrososphaerota archaeon]
MILVGGPASAYLAEKLSKASGHKLIEIEHKLFPDGESYIRFPEKISGEDLLIVQGFHPPQDKHIFQACLMADAALDLGANSVSLIAPYLAYARQDKRFLEGEALSLSTLLKLLKAAGYKRAYTVNVHSPWAIESSPIPVKDVLAEEALAEHIKTLGLEDVVVVSVGKKGKCMAERVAGLLETEYLVAQSTRDKFTGEVTVEIEDDVGGRCALVVDDIISTGGTMAKLVEKLKSMGARRIIAACIHGLMIGDAAERIIRSGAETIISSDTVPSSYSRYSVAGILAREILGRT